MHVLSIMCGKFLTENVPPGQNVDIFVYVTQDIFSVVHLYVLIFSRKHGTREENEFIF